MGNYLTYKSDEIDFIMEYEEIIKSQNETILIPTQWNSEGDFFQKFSLYDESYIPVESLGNTTLIKNISLCQTGMK